MTKLSNNPEFDRMLAILGKGRRDTLYMGGSIHKLNKFLRYAADKGIKLIGVTKHEIYRGD